MNGPPSSLAATFNIPLRTPAYLNDQMPMTRALFFTLPDINLHYSALGRAKHNSVIATPHIKPRPKTPHQQTMNTAGLPPYEGLIFDATDNQALTGLVCPHLRMERTGCWR